MKVHRYTLQTKAKKHNCPQCGEKTFVRYINKESGQILSGNFGRCDRETKCGFFSPPPLETRCYFVPTDKVRSITEKAVAIHQKEEQFTLPKSVIHEELASGIYVAEYFLKDVQSKQVNKGVQPIKYDQSNVKYYSEGGLAEVGKPIEEITEQPEDPVFLPIDVLESTLTDEAYQYNQFLKTLQRRHEIDPEEIQKVCELYLLGTIAKGYLKGALTFPFIDIEGNIRAIQMKQFDEDNHTTKTNFIHSYLKGYYKNKKRPFPDWLAQYDNQKTKVSCLFGEHLLKEFPRNPVALVEAPKTAIYGTLYLGRPKTDKELIWLATYNKSTFKLDRVKALEGRTVIVYPDLSKGGETFKDWKSKAEEFQSEMKNTTFIVSDLIEELATDEDRQSGKDIADFLSEYSLKQFRNDEAPEHRTVIVKRKKQPEAPLLELPFIEEELEPEQKQVEQSSQEGTSEFNEDPEELISFFSGLDVPTTEIRLDKHSVISNPVKFVESHIHVITSDQTTPAAKKRSIEKLSPLKQLLENNKEKQKEE